MTCVFSSHARTALALGVLLLLLILSTQQVLAMDAGDHQPFPRKELQMASAPKAASSRWLLLRRRAPRSTPLWRTLGIKPLGAFCKLGMECSTHTCRNGHCTDPPVRS